MLTCRVSGEYLVPQHSIQKRGVAEEPTIVVVDDDKDFRDYSEICSTRSALRSSCLGRLRSCSKANCYPTW